MDGIYLIGHEMHFASIFGSESYRCDARHRVDERKGKILNLAHAAYVCAGLPDSRLKGNGRDSRCYVRARARPPAIPSRDAESVPAHQNHPY